MNGTPTSPPAPEQNKFGHEELLVVLRNTWEDIERAKQRQWRDFYHTLIVQGAMLSVFRFFDHARLYYVFAISILGVIAFGCLIVWEGETTLDRHRERLRQCYALLEHKTLRELLTPEKPESWYLSLFLSMIVGTGAFAIAVTFLTSP